VLNMIKMDVYRMFRTKSMYVIWIILLASALLTSFLAKIDYDAANKEWEKQQAVESQADIDMQAADVVNAQDIEEQQAADSNKEQLSQQNTDNVNLGISVELPTEPGKKVTVMDVFFSNAQGKFYALFLVIFAVMFATAERLY
jgi:ABC-2 type transport system permease protein